MAPAVMRASDDGPQPGAMARRGGIEHIVPITLLAGHLLQCYGSVLSPAVTHDLERHDVARARARHSLEKSSEVGHVDSADRKDHVADFEPGNRGRRAGQDPLDYEATAVVQLLALLDIRGHHAELRTEHGAPAQHAILCRGLGRSSRAWLVDRAHGADQCGKAQYASEEHDTVHHVLRPSPS